MKCKFFVEFFLDGCEDTFAVTSGITLFHSFFIESVEKYSAHLREEKVRFLNYSWSIIIVQIARRSVFKWSNLTRMGNKGTLASTGWQTIFFLCCVHTVRYIRRIDSFIDLTFFYTELFYYLYLIWIHCDGLCVESTCVVIFYAYNVTSTYGPTKQKCLTQKLFYIFFQNTEKKM